MKTFAAWLFALLLPFSALAAKPDKNKLIDTYMELANVKASHATLAKTVLDTINQVQRQMGVDVNKLPREKQLEIRRIQGVVKTIFSAEVFNKGVATYLAENLDESQLEKANAVLKDSMARRISKLERQMMGKADYNKLKAFHITLSVNPPSKERMRYVDFMDRVSESSKYGSYLTQQIVNLFSLATLGPDTVAQIDKSSKDEVTLTLLYYYRSLTDNDLKGYVEMMADEDVAFVIRQTSKARTFVAGRAFERLSEEIVASGKRVGNTSM